jgi:large subunit ribosomal protein L17
MRKFHRTTSRRRLFIKSVAAGLIRQGKIETTVARAKEIRPVVERLLTIAKKQETAALRTLLARLPRAAAEKLFYEIAPRYKERKGGYLRIIKSSGARKRDGALQAVIEFVQ